MSTPAHAAAAPPAGSGTVVRVVSDGTPWPGAIVREDDGRATLHVDVTLLQETAVWCAAADGHLLTPVDIVRTAGGQEAVFALCQQRLDDLLRSRAEAGAELAAGECVTVAVSVLRGTAEAGDAPCGHWWLTEEGRPVLALGGDASAVDAARGILALLREHARGELATALAAALDAVADPRADLAEAEDALFAAAAPTPLITTVLAPARARSVATALRAETPAPRSALRATIERHVDTEVADRVLGAREDLRERWAARRARRAERRAARVTKASPRTLKEASDPKPPTVRVRRRAPLLTGAAVAAVVLGAGLLWPADEPSSAGSSAPPPAATPSTAATAEATPAPDGPAAAPAPDPAAATDPVAIADGLLSAASACTDEGCRDALREMPGRPVIDGVLGLPAGERQIVLVDDYGGVAVLRVSATAAGSAPDRLLVTVETDQKWLIRDAYDVADQP
ncbi:MULTISPECIES: hypothetical protein [unclassified Microbacterium]|uniref:hypothetical protein n=1 Tax=unclassified Microbacterium TaxID=2609290 RepID=UPI00214B684D|nr:MULTISPECIES: hypothetical protein [unclassified Microbacterium]MCR2785611.1 hypothetical protein [Microbacterium sp. zg.B96]WIM17404.1 hypothetical protein QNO11_07150 [Microbacterium sp. zg-B96]